MGDRIERYIRAVFRHWRFLVVSAVAVVGNIGTIYGQGLSIPRWAWVATAVGGLTVAQFRAWDDMRKERDALIAPEPQFPKSVIRARSSIYGDMAEGERSLVFGVSVVNQERDQRMVLEFRASLALLAHGPDIGFDLRRTFRNRLKDEWADQTPVDPQDFADKPIIFLYPSALNDRWVKFEEVDEGGLEIFYTAERVEIDIHVTDLISGQSRTVRVDQPFRPKPKPPDQPQLDLEPHQEGEDA